MTKWINTIKWNESKAHWWPWNLHLDRVVILNVYTTHDTSIITNSILFSQHFLSMRFMSGVPLLLEVKWRKARYLSLMSPPTGGGSHMNTRCCYSTVSELIMIDIKCNSPTWGRGSWTAGEEITSELGLDDHQADREICRREEKDREQRYGEGYWLFLARAVELCLKCNSIYRVSVAVGKVRLRLCHRGLLCLAKKSELCYLICVW